MCIGQVGSCISSRACTPGYLKSKKPNHPALLIYDIISQKKTYKILKKLKQFCQTVLSNGTVGQVSAHKVKDVLMIAAQQIAHRVEQPHKAVNLNHNWMILTIYKRLLLLRT